MHLYNINFICKESDFTKIATLINFHNAKFLVLFIEEYFGLYKLLLF